jgi:hypothetical protein
MAGEGPVVVLIHGIAGSCPEPARRKTSEARWVGGRIVVLLPAHLRGEARQSTIKWLVDRLKTKLPNPPRVTPSDAREPTAGIHAKGRRWRPLSWRHLMEIPHGGHEDCYRDHPWSLTRVGGGNGWRPMCVRP